ncbi:MAG TPA: hypothetical protein VJY41_04315 [Prolixibacteraceae bacterium]|nr:hypothetical protein [Prolixibacteraceae bacterium]
MNLINKHIKYIKFFGFLLLLGLMVVLNNNIDKNNEQSEKNKQSEWIDITYNNLGTTPVAIQIPVSTEGSLPIKLIYNPHSNLYALANTYFNFNHHTRFDNQKKRYLSYCFYLKNNFLSMYLIGIRNKDIR